MKALLTLALPKGRVLPEAVELLSRAGINAAAALRDDRRLSVDLPRSGVRVLLLKPFDVPTYVEHGAADVGVVGNDVLEECGADVYEPMDLGIGRCRLVIGAKDPLLSAGGNEKEDEEPIRVATKYAAVTRKHFEQRGRAAEIIQVSGSVEIAVAAGLADCVVDLVQTGATLRANHLFAVEVLLQVSSRLIVNRTALKLRRIEVERILSRLEPVL